MDFLRAPYTTAMKMSTNSDVLTPVRWYRADPGARVFPGFHRFTSLNWDGERKTDVPRLGYHGLGEQSSAPRRFTKQPNSGGALGLNFCGPARAFLEGSVIGIDDFYLTDEDGLGPCCLRATQQGTGGERTQGFSVEVTIGCANLPDGALVAYPLTVAGFANDTCAICAYANGTWRCAYVSGCVWRSVAFLFCPGVRFQGVAQWQIIVQPTHVRVQLLGGTALLPKAVWDSAGPWDGRSPVICNLTAPPLGSDCTVPATVQIL